MFLKIRKRREKSAKERLDEMHRRINKKRNKEDYDSIMKFAKSVLDQTKKLEEDNGPLNKEAEHPLVDVIRLIGGKVQMQYLTNLLYQKYESDLPSLLPEAVLFSPQAMLSLDGKEFYDVVKELKEEKTVLLNRDLVLPWSWRKSRLVDCIARIGEGREDGPWQQDYNHRVDLWLPMGIAWVHGGNHSISAGIIQGKGSIKPEAVYDISDVYDYVHCDGVNYSRKEDGVIISPVKNAEIAAIFEIGRLMKENSISY